MSTVFTVATVALSLLPVSFATKMQHSAKPYRDLVQTAQGRDLEMVIVDGRIVTEADAAKALWERAR